MVTSSYSQSDPSLLYQRYEPKDWKLQKAGDTTTHTFTLTTKDGKEHKLVWKFDQNSHDDYTQHAFVAALGQTFKGLDSKADKETIENILKNGSKSFKAVLTYSGSKRKTLDSTNLIAVHLILKGDAQGAIPSGRFVIDHLGKKHQIFENNDLKLSKEITVRVQDIRPGGFILQAMKNPMFSIAKRISQSAREYGLAELKHKDENTGAMIPAKSIADWLREMVEKNLQTANGINNDATVNLTQSTPEPPKPAEQNNT